MQTTAKVTVSLDNSVAHQCQREGQGPPIYDLASFSVLSLRPLTALEGSGHTMVSPVGAPRQYRRRMTAQSSHQPPSMLTRRHLLLGTALVGVLAGCGTLRGVAGAEPPNASTETFEVSHTDAEWRKLLTPEQYDVLRNAGTESPYSSPLNDEHRAGVFGCVGCALELFSSTTKFDSGTGWPSFYQPMDNAVDQREDGGLGMARTEVHCRRCGGHLGHVFTDGPQPTGLRYCMDGVALTFRPT